MKTLQKEGYELFAKTGNKVFWVNAPEGHPLYTNKMNAFLSEYDKKGDKIMITDGGTTIGQFFYVENAKVAKFIEGEIKVSKAKAFATKCSSSLPLQLVAKKDKIHMLLVEAARCKLFDDGKALASRIDLLRKLELPEEIFSELEKLV
jgi:hypothetical protein